jgi:hypothetical protein
MGQIWYLQHLRAWIATGYMLGDRKIGVLFPVGTELSLSGPVLGLTQTGRGGGAPSSGIKAPRREAGN